MPKGLEHTFNIISVKLLPWQFLGCRLAYRVLGCRQ
jgi:hypothetical protein